MEAPIPYIMRLLLLARTSTLTIGLTLPILNPRPILVHFLNGPILTKLYPWILWVTSRHGYFMMS